MLACAREKSSSSSFYIYDMFSSPVCACGCKYVSRAQAGFSGFFTTPCPGDCVLARASRILRFLVKPPYLLSEQVVSACSTRLFYNPRPSTPEYNPMKESNCVV
jgi:hypothetical protein